MLGLSLVPALKGNGHLHLVEGTNCAVKIEEGPKSDWLITVISGERTLTLRLLAKHTQIHLHGLPKEPDAKCFGRDCGPVSYNAQVSREPAGVSVPRTTLGRKLLDVRNRAIKSGIKLLSADEALEEVRRRRGELEDDEL